MVWIAEPLDRPFARPIEQPDTRVSGITEITLPGPVTITPTLGAELLTNGDFSSWSDDNPTGWVVSESGSDPGVTEVAPDGSAGNGAARLYSSATVAQPRIAQSFGTAHSGWGHAVANVTAWVGGALRFELFGSTSLAFVGKQGVGAHFGTNRMGTGAQLFCDSPSTDLVLDSVSVRPIDTASMFYAISDAFVPRVIKAKITRTAFTQAGLGVYVNSSNYLVAYEDGQGRIVLYKRVGGTASLVGSPVSVSYADERELEYNYDPGAKTVTVKYNGATVINAASVPDEVFVTATGARLFSTYSANTFTEVTALGK